MSSTWKRFCRTMRVMGKRRFLYYGSILGMSVGMGMFSVLCSLLMKAVVDISQSGNYHTLFITLVWIVGAGVVSLLVYRSSAVVYNVEAKRVYGVLYEKILNLEMNLPYAYYEKHHSGEIMSKVSYDLGRMGDIYADDDAVSGGCGLSDSNAGAQPVSDSVPCGGQCGHDAPEYASGRAVS